MGWGPESEPGAFLPLMMAGYEPAWLGPGRTEKVPSSPGKSTQRDPRLVLASNISPGTPGPPTTVRHPGAASRRLIARH